jgi:hypothetical protein
MPKIILDNHKNTFEYKIDYEKTIFNIKTISLIPVEKATKNWTDIVSKIKLYAELLYPVYNDINKGIFDERKLTIPIDLRINPYQKNPIFHLNQKIRNEAFKIGSDTDLKSYKTFKIIFQNSQDFDVSVEIDLEIH